ncbi:thioredoxin domain-containing protein [Gloeobacter kilaueensis]|uniref:Thioredoxin n=1 Tax=Gloeobacter kilaueensis (strain ATCC BAA-2537 / CCAP 1431/1 / ULC 316 / JS1) TaxID=1183438 RepID=U5QKU8_GLOK1|nr:thioredoxin domain-containing protein [Gloeobacter kilaueensis]AGY59546.1 thioredoxin [Gloeobacter kilaueensis JS1]
MDTASGSRMGIWIRNGIVAVATVLIAVLVFFASRSQSPSLAQMATTAVPLEQALTSGRPTFVEFYADWCSSCQTMAPVIAQLKERYGSRANFVMLNVDNPRWLPELQQYKVYGIPHYAFLDDRGRPLGSVVGLQPSTVLADNLSALVAGERQLPGLTAAPGRTSTFTPPKRAVQPTDHS